MGSKTKRFLRRIFRGSENSDDNSLASTSGYVQRSVQNIDMSYRFSLAVLQEATNNFDENWVIGIGGFGKVYKGVLRDDTKIAAKRFNLDSSQGFNEFRTEIELLSRLRHRHLVSLLGYCDEDDEMILVYELMEKGSLKNHLYRSNKPTLSWKQRLEICIGASRGLHYLHTCEDKAIIHRDVKSATILLDETLTAKVGDLGLARIGPGLDESHVSTAVKGSFGYLDPEYFRRQQLTEKSDVYSFGVVLFEVLCARPAINPSLPRDEVNLAEWVIKWQKKGQLDEIVDPKIAGTIRPESLRVFGETAEKCLAEYGTDRPTMADVLRNLEHALQLQENDFATKVEDIEENDGMDVPNEETPSIEDDGPVIGIDLGTSNCCMAVWHNGDVMVIHDDDGNRIIPAYVAFTEDEVLFGDAAKHQLSYNSNNTVFGVKRLLGRKFSNETVQKDMELWPYKVIEEDNDEPEIVVEYMEEEKRYKPQDILSIMLQNLKELAEKKLNQSPLKYIVVTVPIYFTQSQRMIIIKAAEAAGLQIRRFIYEPTAAALAYTLKYNSDKIKNVLVFDLGGGTLDVSLLQMEKFIVEVKAIAGDHHLGGEDFDGRLINYLCQVFSSQHHVDISGNLRSIAKLKEACESAKKHLCMKKEQSAKIEIESLYRGIDFCETIECSKFEELNEDLFLKCLEPVKECLNQSGLKVNEVDEVILVGGSSQIPKIRDLLQELFEGKTLFDALQPEEVVASGAAILGATTSHGKDHFLMEFNLKDATPASLGVAMKDGGMRIFIERNTPIPTKQVTDLPLNQLPITLLVYEGEKSIANENHKLGQLGLQDFASSGDCILEVSFNVDVNNAVQVTAKDTKSGISIGQTFSDGNGRLTINEITEMVEENEKISSEKKREQKKRKAVNELKALVHLVDTKLKDENRRNVLGNFLHRTLKFATMEMLEWLERDVYKVGVRDVERKMTDFKLIVEPFKNRIGISLSSA